MWNALHCAFEDIESGKPSEGFTLLKRMGVVVVSALLQFFKAGAV